MFTKIGEFAQQSPVPFGISILCCLGIVWVIAMMIRPMRIRFGK